MTVSMIAMITIMMGGCGSSPKQQAETTLTLLCGGAIRPPIVGADSDKGGILDLFAQTHPDVTIETTYGASNLLLGQIKLIGTGDLFLPGDDFYIEEAKNEGLVYDTRTVALFVPVIMTANGNPLGIQDIQDLADPDVRLAISEPRAAAVGRITPKIFEKNGVSFDALDNIVFTGVTAPEVAQAVAMGHADVTITWRPVAMLYKPNAAIIDIAPEKNIVSPLVIAVLQTSENKELALAFVDSISSAEGQEIFVRYHYDVDSTS